MSEEKTELLQKLAEKETRRVLEEAGHQVIGSKQRPDGSWEIEVGSPKAKRSWVKIEKNVIGLEGYPIRIRMLGGKLPFTLEVDGRLPLQGETLSNLKALAEMRADELDQFA